MSAQPKLAAAMAKAFAEIEAATKDATNPHFRSKYADLTAVIGAIKPALVANDLFFTQPPRPAEGGVCVETVLHHSSGENMSLGTLFVPANKQDAQGYGSALSYCRRYALLSAFGVPTEDDDGNAAVKSAPVPANANNGINRDAPFPQGPAKNKTDLKAQGRDFWRDVEACEDGTQLDALIASHATLIKQLRDPHGLPDWWNGGSKNGEPYEGLSHVIERKQRDFAALAGDHWKQNPVLAG